MFSSNLVKCRICLLNNGSEAELVPLFIKNENIMHEMLSVTNADLIMMFASVQIEQNDRFPQNICRMCHSQLLQAYEFKIRCENSDRFLHEQTQIIQTADPSKVDVNIPQKTENDLFKTEIFSCNTCFELFPSEEILAEHTKHCCQHAKRKKIITKNSIRQKKEYACSVCSANFASCGALKNHRRTVHNCKSLCSVCNAQVSNVLKHHFEAHGFKECNVCNKKLSTTKSYLRHVKLECVQKKQMYLCPDCGRCFTNATNYKVHLRIHTGEKPYECEICKKRFTQWSTLRSHRISHTNKKEFACEICGNTFKFKSGLNRHVLSHTGERKHVCEVCNKRFKRSSDLKDHLVVHSGVKNFKCEFCNKAFGFKKNLVVHMRTHTGARPFVCQICAYAFTQAHCLRSHMNTHHKNEKNVDNVK